MRVGVVVNERSGGGRTKDTIIRELCNAWHGHTLIGCAGYGGEMLDEQIAAPEISGFLPRLHHVIDSLIDKNVDMLVTVGGDGTAAYVANALISRGMKIPILGIGTGTANVGPIVTVREGEPIPNLEELEIVPVGGVGAFHPEHGWMCWAFNDLVLGNTLLGTINGKVVTLDACRMAKSGEKIPTKCKGNIIELPGLIVGKNGSVLETVTQRIPQIIVSAVERDSFYGRAITGMLCYTPDSPYQAAILFPTRPLVSYEENPYGFERLMWSGQLLFRAEDRIHLDGLCKDICVIADGNPYLLGAGSIDICYAAKLVNVAQRRKAI